MKWNKEKKAMLRDAILRMKETHETHEWDRFMDSFGIKKVERHRRNPWKASGYTTWTYEECGSIARTNTRVIVNDYFFLEGVGWCWSQYDGLSIPKEVANKFLVLGVP